MKSLSQELKAVITKRLDTASPREILAIASSLCDDGPIELSVPPRAEAVMRFTADGDVVLDRLTGLMWTRDDVPGGRMTSARGVEVCGKLELGGFRDWRLPTTLELRTLIDYERHNPAIDTVFKCQAAYYVTSTPVASSPGCVWYVYFYYGYVYWYYVASEGFVRGVRASQSLDLWHVR